MNKFGRPDRVQPAGLGPTNFHWLVPGLLGGTPRPGLTTRPARDLEALQRVNTRLLVSLTQEWQPDTTLLAAHDIASLYVPIPDLAPPTQAQARLICAEVEAYITKGHAVVFHCHAGRGRTGTLLAAMLIWGGSSADAAIRQTRGRNKKWIETESQLGFLSQFAREMTGAAGAI